jgi:hypothetical protein
MPTPPTGEPELIVTLRVGSVISGECSACHEVIVVKGIGAETPVEWVYTIEQGFLEHIRREHSADPQSR